MHDTLHYVEQDPVYRSYNHGAFTFGMVYAFSERFILPLSHDEVVHGKGSLIRKMPGDEWQRFANLRAYFGYMWAHPGKKLLFMGGEIAQEREWNHDASYLGPAGLAAPCRGSEAHPRPQPHLRGRAGAAIQRPHATGFEWAVADDAENSVLGMLRSAQDRSSQVLIISNLTPVPRNGYRVGVSMEGRWEVVLNTDAAVYGGADLGQIEVWTERQPTQGKEFSLPLTLPPLATVFLRWKG